MPTLLLGKPLTFGDVDQLNRLDENERIKKLLTGKKVVLDYFCKKYQKISRIDVNLAYMYLENIDTDNMANFDGAYTTVAHKMHILEDYYDTIGI